MASEALYTKELGSEAQSNLNHAQQSVGWSSLVFCAINLVEWWRCDFMIL